jgi:3-phosphoshikimate 1-carboxyvinyltransferase
VAVAAPSLAVAPAGRLRGTLAVPGDKSISHRYLLLGAIADGATTITNLSPGADVAASVGCLQALGVRIDEQSAGAVVVHGRAGDGLARPAGPLDAANSGTLMRLLAGLLAGCPFETTLTGDASLRRRPMRRIIDPLTAMGARIRSLDGRPPLEILGGRLAGIRWTPPVPSAQVKSALLLAGLAATGTTTVCEPAPTRDHTERAFPVFGLDVSRDGLSVSVTGPQRPRSPAVPLAVPGDPSSAAVWAAAAAALPGSSVRLTGVGLNPRRTAFLGVLTRMGADVDIEHRREQAHEPVGDVVVTHGPRRRVTIAPEEVPDLIDELPVLAASAALGAGLDVSGASELRVKESDRITALVTGLRQLGVTADERPDGFAIDGASVVQGGRADAAGDHRLVMAFALVALGAAGPSSIDGAGAVAVSYPGFGRDLAALIA